MDVTSSAPTGVPSPAPGRPRRARGAGTVAALVSGALLLVVFGHERAVVIGVIGGATYGLVALGLVLVYKSSGAFNFAQGEFGTVAVYALFLLHSAGVPYALGAVGGLAAAVGFGLVVERLVIRRLFDAPRVTLLVATASVALLAIGVEVWLGQPRPRRIEPALPGVDRVTVLGTQVSDQRLLLLAGLVAVGVVLVVFFTRTSLGLAVLAASQQPVATELVGIDVRRISSLVWAMAAFVGGLAGILSAPIAGAFGPGFLTSGALIAGFTAAVLGGMASLPGAFVGGAIVGVAQALAVDLDAVRAAGIPSPGALALFLLLLIVLAVRPQGLLGGR